ncbi:chromosome alignment-maintaining phosphoprotein 1-like [Bufo bufo]|uniref:chromosome alignment-maintaining phosphoprotein 1-like n=1 Tax=Bufo bufo TaxID=8384 RepID=UPI001ABED666|nr:chromosome alignment-maintaining phosphoprotein 1-like [Bufo bufo]XP_040280938.1 chromosome alignment-maintaining phosphoprotein 1-like [Bufo bufo]XP_040280939.1 chromosome alignment-maintaining phosphoprotein 1-like [Bufo bufo]
MEILRKLNELDCSRCSFHGADYKSVQIHMGTIHPEFCEEIDTGGLGKLVFYQKSARLFHCHRCFFTSKVFSNVYYHILGQHAEPDKSINKLKPILKPKSEKSFERNDSESMVSEDEKSIDEKFKLKEVKSEENDTLTSWPENVPCQVTQDSSDIELKSSSSSSMEKKARAIFPETKDSSCDPESSSSSDNISTEKSAHANLGVEFSDVASSPSKDIPEFSDEDYGPALPGGLPHFSDEETVTQSKDVQESSEDDVLPDQSRGIEDISEDEMPLEEKPIHNISEDESVPVPSKPEDSSSEEEMAAPVKDMMEFSDEEDEDNMALSKADMEFSEEEEVINERKNVETTNASKNVMDFSEEEETTNASRNVMEFSEEEETPGLSKDIMEFSEEDDDDDDAAPAISKSIMEFSEEEDISPQSKDMPKYLEGNSTPTQSKDSEYAEDADASVFKGSSPFSEDETLDECTSVRPRDLVDKSKSLTDTAHLSGAAHFSEFAGTPSWSKDGLDTSDSGDVSLSAPDTLEVSDDKDSYLKDEEIMQHVKRVKARYQCMLCDYRPLKKGPIVHHLITRHNMPSPFVCKTCGETFVVETHLKTHLSSHTKGLYKCHRCNFQTDHPRGFKKHQTHCERCHKDDSSKPVVGFQEEDHEEP